MRILLTLATVAGLVVVTGCTQTDCVSAAEEAHAIFLEEVALNPEKYSPEELRNERLAFAAAKRACMVFGRAAVIK